MKSESSVHVVGRVERGLVTTALWIVAALTVVPLALVVAKAVEPASGSGYVDLGNFSRAWTQGDFGTALVNSLIVSTVVVIVCVVLATLAGYALGVLRPRGGALIAVLFVLGIIVPFEALVIPLYFQLRGGS